MDKKQSQSGSAHLIVIILLVVALVGALGFVYYQNFMQPKANNANTNTIIDDTAEKTMVVTPSISPAAVVDNFVESYLSYGKTPNHNAGDFVAQSLVVTDSFISSVNNSNNPYAFADPILFVQDYPSEFTVGAATIIATSSIVPVTLNYPNDNPEIVFTLTLVGNEWKIDSVARA